jgi:uncharacterized membrane protein YfcA
MKKLKEFSVMFFIQIVSYTLLCINYRAVAQAHYVQSAASDFIIATLSFFVIKKIAHGDNTFHQWLGYALGGVVGSILGIYVSTLMLGQ